MSEHFQATYEDGVLRPDQPLALPESARVSGIVIPISQVEASDSLSEDELDRELNELSLDAPLLPSDFSRADIYLDHD